MLAIAAGKTIERPPKACQVTRLFKIITRADWEFALKRGCFEGSADDLADGYIHLSTAEQVQETADRHFKGQKDLLLLIVDSRHLGDRLRWEVARGGESFPHLYGPLSPTSVTDWRTVKRAPDGTQILGDLAI